MLRTTMNKDYFLELFDASEAFGVEIEGHRECNPRHHVMRPTYPYSYLMLVDTETGPGVYETALAYTEARRMADNAVLFKLLAKSVGIKYGIMPTFMAKPWADVSTLSFLAMSAAAY
jgi:glutamine synthetase